MTDGAQTDHAAPDDDRIENPTDVYPVVVENPTDVSPIVPDDGQPTAVMPIYIGRTPDPFADTGEIAITVAQPVLTDAAPPDVDAVAVEAASVEESVDEPTDLPPPTLALPAIVEQPYVAPWSADQLGWPEPAPTVAIAAVMDDAERVAPVVRRPASSLEADAVSAWYGSKKVLERVSLVMTPASVTALIGPSGCGKSTFLRILNRMHENTPTAKMGGRVLLDGDDIYAAGHRVTDTRRRIGMVFQKPNPFPTMSIADNVTAGLKLTGHRLSRADRADLVEHCLTRAGLWREVRDRLGEHGGALSGGQQQRLCIARSLAVDPDVLLMDEPCSALDPTSTRFIEDTISELSADMTIVIVTHNMQQAARVSHHSAFFLAEDGAPGRIVESAPTEQLFNHPVDPRTADYVHGRFG
ncbi:MAG: phosphate transporter ATP-binding protein [Ilumatobacteraceae bacterium]|nr:phosphate transporter ATP-binding protein [Ilumatobacteraceae bacterium]